MTSDRAERRARRMPRPEQSERARKEARAKHLATKLGGTVEQWIDRHDRMYEHQEGRCMYCRKPGDDLAGRKPLVVDEEHFAPFRVRGLGHPKCNQLAGLYEEALANPPAFGVVDYEVPEHKVAARVRAEDLARARRGRKQQPKEKPGERQTYTFPDRPNQLKEAIRELEGVTVA